MPEDGTEAVDARKDREKRNSHIEAMAAVTAIVVSVASLYIALRQTYVMERQLEASVWPSLVYDTSNTGDDGKHEIRFELKNGGVGPARVRSLELSFHGKVLTGYTDLLSECAPQSEKNLSVGGVQVVDVRGRLLPAGQSISFLTVTPSNDDDPYYKHLNEVHFDVDGRVCYCSALEQCWTLGFHESEPAPVHDCAEAAKRPQYVR